ncbi:alpha-galactosidase [Bacteroides caecigallinarum]|nr:alpha-galactosidase [Bacteroides caecigallinarum]
MKNINMKQFFLLAGASIFVTNALFAQNICISTPNTSLVLKAQKGGELKYLYYGNKLSETDFENIEQAGNCNHNAYPVYGMNCPGEVALSVKHADGNMSTQMSVVDVDTYKNEQTTVTSIKLKDNVYPFYVDVYYKAYSDVDMIETWTEISHTEKKPVLLTQYSSAYLPIRRGNVWLSHLYGSWANEGQLAQEQLEPGMTVIKNKDGVRNSHTSHSEVMFSLDGKPQENKGRVIGAALCYTGNYKLRIDTDDSDYHQFYAGINEENSSYSLDKKEVFKTPALAITYSNEGLSGASRNFHKWGRMYKLAHGDKERDILLNSWEGVYFDINQKGMDQMMEDISSMGGELFVMDDGWFGDKYPRNNDTSSLGDWVVDEKKLPEGIDGLIRDAKKHGIKFGIWIEPEMANTTSELYEKHPEWIIKSPQREPVLGRGGTQVVLDLANPEVQDFAFDIVDNLMTKHPEIAYIKWDANMAIMNHGSNYLTKDNQSHMYIEYHKGFEKVCQRIREKYPDLVIQACASGGGRANYGYLPYFDEFWVSDNTDALQRVYMQWGTSYFFPAIAMASHISAAPNHQTFRTIPLKYRIDVAMSGRLGMEIQPKNMTDEEKDLCRKAIADYKKIRPVVQFGNIYRLISPYDKLGVASLMYISDVKDKAVFYWWKTEHFVNQHLPRVIMAGLDPEKKYKVMELNRIDNVPLEFEGKVFSGAYLMANGLEIPYNHKVDYHKQNDYSSRVLYLEEVK